MRFDCFVELDGEDTARIGFRPTGSAQWNWSDWAVGTIIEFVLYNFTPGTTYEYKIVVAGGSPQTTATTLTGGPSLPTLLDDLNLQVTNSAGAHSTYVMFDTYDCEGVVATTPMQYLVVVEADSGEIVWYQDVDAVTDGATITGWSYTSDDTILAIVDRAYVYEWALDGSDVITAEDFSDDCLMDGTGDPDEGPCPHHDAFRCADNGKTYVVTGTFDSTILPTDTTDFGGSSTCNSWDGFVDDGARIYNSTFSSYADHTLMADMDFDPSVDGGPLPDDCTGPYYWGALGFHSGINAVDWTHVNSVSAVKPGTTDRLNLSLRQWSEVLRYNPTTTSVDWALNGLAPGTYGFTLQLGPGISGGTADFGGQHHFTEDDGLFLMFDNGNMGGSTHDARALQIDIDTSPDPDEATILRSWEMREYGTPWNGLTCSGLGNAVMLPGTQGKNVLATCGPETTIQEIDEYDGQQTTDPVLEVSLDNDGTGGWDHCSTGTDPTGSGNPNRFYRAWPLLELGEF